MDRSLRQRRIVEFCFRHNGSQPSTARHGHSVAADGDASSGQSDLTTAWQTQAVEVIEPAQASSTKPSQAHGTVSQAQPDLPLSIASSHSSSYNHNVGLQLCACSCPVTASLWTTLETPERKALQAVCYFINSDLRWYIKDLPAINTSQGIAKLAGSEHPTDDDTASRDSEAHTVYRALFRIVG